MYNKKILNTKLTFMRTEELVKTRAGICSRVKQSFYKTVKLNNFKCIANCELQLIRNFDLNQEVDAFSSRKHCHTKKGSVVVNLLNL
jgi:hypothetical protein